MSFTANHRTLHLIDLDNHLGGISVYWGATQVDQWLAHYRRNVGIVPGDHVIVAACPTIAASAFFALPSGWQLLIGRGLDGADSQLLDALSPEFIASHYSDVVIASGDHAFAPFATDLAGRGRHVAVALGAGQIASRLQVAAHEVIRLPYESTARAAVAA